MICSLDACRVSEGIHFLTCSSVSGISLRSTLLPFNVKTSWVAAYFVIDWSMVGALDIQGKNVAVLVGFCGLMRRQKVYGVTVSSENWRTLGGSFDG